MASITTLTDERSNQRSAEQSVTLPPPHIQESSWFRLIDEYYATQPTTIGDPRLPSETWAPRQESFISPCLSDLTAEIDANQRRIRGAQERLYGGIVSYIVMEPPNGVKSIDQQSVAETTEDVALANSNTQQDLVDALDDLSEVIEEAEEKGYQSPSEMAVSEAKSLLEMMYEIAPQRFEVYPMPQGEVTIDATNENGHYLMLLIASDGSARSLTNSASGRSRQHFASIDDVTSEFLRDTFLEIDVSNG